MDEKNTDVMKGALLLTLAGLAGKVLSAGYRIPLQNLTGDVGFYIYQQVYPLLGIVITLSLYGFPSAISKMAVELNARDKGVSFRYFYFPVFLLLFFITTGIFLLLFFNAGKLAMMVGDTYLTETYKLAAFAFLLIPFTALLRGVLQGTGRMKPTAYSQIGEQFIRVILIITAAIWISGCTASIYLIGNAAAIASMAGAVVAIVILVWFFVRNRPPLLQRPPISWRYYIHMLLTLGIAAAMNHMVLIIIQLADTITLVPGLRAFGMTKLEAMTTKGIFDRGQPLIQLGTVLGSSFALSLLPAVSEQAVKDKNTLHHSVQRALVVSLYLAAGATAGLIAIFPEVNRLLFQSDAGTGNLRVLVIAIFLSSLGITAASILQGLGYVKRTALFIIVAFFVKWLGNTVLVPYMGMAGGATATVISLACLAMMMLVTLKHKLPQLAPAKQVNWYALFVALTGMIAFLIGMDWLVGPVISRTGLLLYVLFISATGGVIYLLLLVRLQAFRETELSMLPFARLWIQLHKARD
ncbi:polysaccharide biosynthesis protein [Lentibacillus cibarius]|uniref:Polysaccharide biosynthesis protein n=1 Tax=Lentibacillus cibarius TaxID=2583219 RepID=A0A549YGV9_9BACI|nr:polysaccharide biosynthesis protein [Lentibacillus cibarius]TRM11119.1 polysaccharide biosynthesis protein [Lentibacillus cibarius]